MTEANANDHRRCELLVQAILDGLHVGLTLSAEAMAYVDATFWQPSLAEIAQILQDEENCDKDALEQLVFFPDESLQMRLEPLLTKYAYQKADEQRLLQMLMAAEPQVRVCFHGRDGFLSLHLTEVTAKVFIRRLCISRRLDPRLVGALSSLFSRAEALKLCVKLRNTRFEQTAKRIFFLRNFLKTLRAQDALFDEALGFILAFLDELTEDEDLYLALMAKKQRLCYHLERAVRFERQLRCSNMETMMLQGFRAAHVDVDQTRRQIEIVDAICLAVFGRTETCGEDHQPVEVFDRTDLETLKHKLSAWTSPPKDGA